MLTVEDDASNALDQQYLRPPEPSIEPTVTKSLYRVEIGNSTINTSESLSLNEQRRGMDNEWLYQQVQRGMLHHQSYVQLQTVKDLLQQNFPDMWDIHLELRESTVIAKYKTTTVSNNVPIPIGYYGYDTPPIDPITISDVDESISDWMNVGTMKSIGFKCYVKFADITVTNTAEMSHNIKDIYYELNFVTSPTLVTQTGEYFAGRMPNGLGISNRYTDVEANTPTARFNISGIDFELEPMPLGLLPKMKGFRTTVTANEFAIGYSFSHLRNVGGASAVNKAKNYVKPSSCCLGSGEITMTLTMISAEFTPEMFQMLLLQIDAYTRWESVEGVPYMYIKALVSTGYKQYNEMPSITLTSVLKLYLEELLRVRRFQIERGESIPVLNWKLNPDGISYTLMNDDAMNDFCKISEDYQYYADDRFIPTDTASGDRGSTQFKRLVFFKENGLFVNPFIRETELVESHTEYLRRIGREIDQIYFLFRGRRDYFKILPKVEQTEETLSGRLYINKTITQTITDKFQKHANAKKIENDIVARATAIKNHQRNF